MRAINNKRVFGVQFPDKDLMVRLHWSINTLDELAVYLLMRAMKDDESGNYNHKRMSSRIEFLESYVSSQKELDPEYQGTSETVIEEVALSIGLGTPLKVFWLDRGVELSNGEYKDVCGHLVELFNQSFNPESYV